METKKNIYLNEHGNKVIIEEEGIELKKDNRTVGTRRVVDEYGRNEINKIKEHLKGEIKQLEDLINKSQTELNELSKKYTKRMENKVKEFLKVQSQVEAFKKLGQLKQNLQNYKYAKERNIKDLAMLMGLE